MRIRMWTHLRMRMRILMVTAAQRANQRHSNAFTRLNLILILILILIWTEIRTIYSSAGFFNVCVCVCVGECDWVLYLHWCVCGWKIHRCFLFYLRLCVLVKWFVGPKIKMKSFTFGKTRMNLNNFWLTGCVCEKWQKISQNNKTYVAERWKGIFGNRHKFGDLNKIK